MSLAATIAAAVAQLTIATGSTRRRADRDPDPPRDAPGETGGRITVARADPVGPSAPGWGRAGDRAGCPAAIAKLWRIRGGAGQDIAVDLRVAPNGSARSTTDAGSCRAAFRSVRRRTRAATVAFRGTADDRWVMPLNP